MMIKEMSDMERPREKALLYGIENLSNVELLALLIRCGTKKASAVELAQQILAISGGMDRLIHLQLCDLVEIKGIKSAKALEFLASIELAKRIKNVPFHSTPEIKTAMDVFNYIGPRLSFENQEHFYVLFLNTKHRVIKEKLLFLGTLNMSVVHPREVFKEAVSCSSAAVICVHNHPSGNPEPSKEDVELTKSLMDIGVMMDIPVLDHIIIGKETYFSLKANGFLE